MKMWRGIDVSDNQGLIDWLKVKMAGVEFAILRSVRRSGKEDYQFANNLAGCRANGIPVAVYKYTYAMTVEQARAEALQVVALLQKYGLTKVKVWWDVEDRGTVGTLSQSVLTECIEAAKEVIEEAGYRFGLYIGLYVYREAWFMWERFASLLPWVARYPSSAQKYLDYTPSDNYKPQVWTDLWGWQTSSNGCVDGIDGPVDLNICYFDPAEDEAPAEEPGVFWTVSIADTTSAEIAEAVAKVHSGCNVHKVECLDVGGIVIWIASAADVWTRLQAENALEMLQRRSITGLIHRCRIASY